MKSSFFLLSLSFLLTACMTSVTYSSNPPGAYISSIKTGKGHGVAPVTLYYEVNSNSPKHTNGCYLLDGLRAQWVSGAYKDFDTVWACKIGGFHSITFDRPVDLPGLDKDLIFANQLEATKNANSARNADAWATFFRAISATQTPPVQSLTPTRPLYLRGQSYINGNNMCSYDDGSVINVGAGVCPIVK
jgi:hypothetical protein